MFRESCHRPCRRGSGTFPEAREATLTNSVLSSLSRPELEDLVVDLSKRWLAHDGLWFQAVEADQGMPTAIRYDTAAWSKFTVLEAKRILAFLGLAPGGGLEALERALPLRLYGFVNTQEMIRVDAHTLVLRMNDCRVQSAAPGAACPLSPAKVWARWSTPSSPARSTPASAPVAWSARPTPTPPTSIAPGSSSCRRGRPKATDPGAPPPARAAKPGHGGLGRRATVPTAAMAAAWRWPGPYRPLPVTQGGRLPVPVRRLGRG